MEPAPNRFTKTEMRLGQWAQRLGEVVVVVEGGGQQGVIADVGRCGLGDQRDAVRLGEL